MSDILDPANHIASVQALAEMAKAPAVQEMTNPLRRATGENLARTADIVGGFFNATLSPMTRFTQKTESKNRMQAAELASNERSQATGLAIQEQSHAFVEYLKQTEFFEELVAKVAQIPEEDLQVPAPYVAGPALEALRFAEDDPDLRAMYANLLASAMDKRVAETAHPSFVEILKQLSPDEARIVGILGPGKLFPLVSLYATYPHYPWGPQGGQRGRILYHHSTISQDAGCQFPEMISVYMDNLCRLGIVVIPENTELFGDTFYKPLVNPAFLKKSEVAWKKANNRLQDFNTHLVREALLVTDLGKNFFNACVIGPEGNAQVMDGVLPEKWSKTSPEPVLKKIDPRDIAKEEIGEFKRKMDSGYTYP